MFSSSGILLSRARGVNHDATLAAFARFLLSSSWGVTSSPLSLHVGTDTELFGSALRKPAVPIHVGTASRGWLRIAQHTAVPMHVGTAAVPTHVRTELFLTNKRHPLFLKYVPT